MKAFIWAALAAAAISVAGCGKGSENNKGQGLPTADRITGAGSTFVYPVLAAWSADYAKQTGTAVNYQSIGSGGGVSQIKAGTVDFGATDQPLEPKELAQSGLAQFPVVIGGVVPVVNIAGLDAGKLKLTGPVLADIYAGTIKKWNDPAIATINAGLALPGADIAVVHRSFLGLGRALGETMAVTFVLGNAHDLSFRGDARDLVDQGRPCLRRCSRK